jgi:hypothetical protein
VLPESSRGDGGFGSTGGHNGTAPGVIVEVQNNRSV